MLWVPLTTNVLLVYSSHSSIGCIRRNTCRCISYRVDEKVGIGEDVFNIVEGGSCVLGLFKCISRSFGSFEEGEQTKEPTQLSLCSRKSKFSYNLYFLLQGADHYSIEVVAQDIQC